MSAKSAMRRRRLGQDPQSWRAYGSVSRERGIRDRRGPGDLGNDVEPVQKTVDVNVYVDVNVDLNGDGDGNVHVAVAVNDHVDAHDDVNG